MFFYFYYTGKIISMRLPTTTIYDLKIRRKNIFTIASYYKARYLNQLV